MQIYIYAYKVMLRCCNPSDQKVSLCVKTGCVFLTTPFIQPERRLVHIYSVYIYIYVYHILCVYILYRYMSIIYIYFKIHTYLHMNTIEICTYVYGYHMYICKYIYIYKYVSIDMHTVSIFIEPSTYFSMNLPLITSFRS